MQERRFDARVFAAEVEATSIDKVHIPAGFGRGAVISRCRTSAATQFYVGRKEVVRNRVRLRLALRSLQLTAWRVAARILVLFAHPALQKSRINVRLLAAARAVEGITFNDLYEEYPTFQIDVAREQKLLLDHDIIVFQHPFYSYSCPALLKEWLDLVLEHGFAYGHGGDKLHGKRALSAVTTGGPEAAYSPAGMNHFTLDQLLAPFEQTARLCGMSWLPPFAVHGAHRLTDPNAVEQHASDYARVLTGYVMANW